MTLWVSLLLVGALGALVYVAEQHSSSASRAVHRADRAQQQRNLARLTGQYVRFAARDLQSLSLSRSWSLEPASPSDTAALRRYIDTTPVFRYGAVVADLTGNPRSAVARGPVPARSDAGYGPLRADLLAGQPGVSRVLHAGNHWVVAVAVPIVTAGRPSGLIIGYADLRQWPLEGYVRSLSLGPQATYTIVDDENQIVASSKPQEIGRHLATEVPTPDTVTDKHGMVTSAAAAGIGGWSALTAQPASTFYGDLEHSRQWLMVALALTLVVAVLCVVVVDHRRRQALDRLAQEAIFDPLTGAATRRLLDLRLVAAVARGRRSGTSTAVFYCDLDGFKQINDRLGHNVGDQALVAAARVLRTTLREDDLLARVGGDEFVILVEGVTHEADVRRLAERIVREVADPIVIGHRLLSLQVSVGVAVLPPGQECDDLLAVADAAMYEAKRSGLGWQVTRVPGEPTTPAEVSQETPAHPATAR